MRKQTDPKAVRKAVRELRNVLNNGKPGWNGEAEGIVCDLYGDLRLFYTAVIGWQLARAVYQEAIQEEATQ